MELATAAFAAVFGGGGIAATGAGAAASAAGAGAATAGAGAAASSGVLSVLQGISATMSVLGAIGAGSATKSQMNDMANQTELESNQEQLQATQRQTSMKRELARVLGENDVTFAAAGIDLSGGIAQSAATAAKTRAADEISIDRSDSDFRRAMLKQRANGFRAKGKSAMGGALLNAIQIGANYGADLYQRG